MQPLLITQRLQFGLLTAAMVFVTTCLASWVAMRNSMLMDSQTIYMNWGMVQGTQSYLTQYAREHGEYPETLSELDLPSEHLSDATRDPWGNPLEYSKTDNGFRLASLGRDGKPGGQGLDADVYSDQSSCSDQAMANQTQLPLSQFLFQTAGSPVVLGVALLAGICAGAVSYLVYSPAQGPGCLQDKVAAELRRASRFRKYGGGDSGRSLRCDVPIWSLRKHAVPVPHRSVVSHLLRLVLDQFRS